MFVNSPYADACEVWDVEATEPPRAPDAPTLVLTGDLDSWSRPEWFDGAAPGFALPGRSVTQVNVLDPSGLAPC